MTMVRSLQSLIRARGTAARATLGPIGLDLAQDRLNLAQFSSSAAGPEVQAAASLAYPVDRDTLLASPPRLKAFLRDAWHTHGFKGRKVVSCLRPEELRILLVNYTAPDGSDDAQAIAAELRERLRGELATSIIDYLPIRNEDGDPTRRDALVVVAPRDNVVRHLDLLNGAGLEVTSLDVGPAALARLASFVNAATGRDTHPNVLLINFGQLQSHLSVVWGRRLILDRTIDFGERALVERLSRVLDMGEALALQLLQRTGFAAPGAARSDDEDLARTLAEVLRPEFSALVAEINKTLVYTASRSRGRSIDQIYLLGSVGRYPGVDFLMQQLLELPVAVMNPFASFRSLLTPANQEQLKPIAGIALAFGLSLRGLQDRG